MNTPRFRIFERWSSRAATIALLALGLLTLPWWRPALLRLVDESIAAFRTKSPEVEESDEHDEHSDDHHGHDHAHGGHTHAGHAHNDEQELALSPQGLLNLGLTPDQIQPVSLQNYQRSINLPAMVVERPGQTELNVSAPLTGVIEHVHAVEGESVLPGTLLFQIRLTHEDLVQAQVDFVKTLGELDVENKEIARLQNVTLSGAVAGKTLLERIYAKEKLDALLSAQRESLRLHGLSPAQIQSIETDRRLMREMQVMAPWPDEHHHGEEFELTSDDRAPAPKLEVSNSNGTPAVPLTIHHLKVNKGQSVSAGESLCTLADFHELFIAGSAFERDAGAVFRVLENNWKVTAIFDLDAGERRVEGLNVHFLSHEVDPQTRALKFFIALPNEIVRDTTDDGHRRYVAWRYRPGQRLRLRMPVEEWKDQIVLGVDAVAREGAENYVFVQDGKHFDRRRVHVEYRDQDAVVIANDGSLFPGDRVALRGAHQMQMALKNKSGGAVDPHAGHNH